MTETKQATDIAHAKSEHRLPALVVSRGIGIGRIVFLHGEERRFFRLDLNAGEIEAELGRFRSALDTSILQLRELAVSSNADTNQPVSGIFGVHLLILESSFVEKIEAVIKSQRVNAEWAVRKVSDEFLEKQVAVSDLRFRDKSLDIGDVANRLLTALSGSPATTQTDPEAVIVARDLTPSLVMELAKNNPAAFITEYGGWTSHASIIAREFQLPMVSGVRNLEHFARTDDRVIVDGDNGEVILNPGDETIAKFRAPVGRDKDSSDLQHPASHGTVTLDGTRIVIRANIDRPESYAAAKNYGPQGIGLFRSESLIRSIGAIPSEDEQFAAYCKIAELAGGAGVNVRTFDLGVGQIAGSHTSAERNPSLGLRSMRLSLSEPVVFRTQIRALLRAAFYNRIDIILPMISGVSEILSAKAIIDEERANLSNAGIEIGTPKLGAMIETPSAVFTASEIAAYVDFLCLGTNDLVQYLLAVDRDNDAVADWYQTLHPAVLKAISEVLSTARNSGIPVTVCGEMAGSPFYVPVLLGLGARELSMNVNSIRPVRQLLSGISVSDCVALVDKVKTCITAKMIENHLREYYIQNWSSLFLPEMLSARHR